MKVGRLQVGDAVHYLIPRNVYGPEEEEGDAFVRRINKPGNGIELSIFPWDEDVTWFWVKPERITRINGEAVTG